MLNTNPVNGEELMIWINYGGSATPGRLNGGDCLSGRTQLGSVSFVDGKAVVLIGFIK